MTTDQGTQTRRAGPTQEEGSGGSGSEPDAGSINWRPYQPLALAVGVHFLIRRDEQLLRSMIDPEIVELCEQIVEAQRTEIAQMREILERIDD